MVFRVEYDPASEHPVLLAKKGKGCLLLDAQLLCRFHAVKSSQCRTFPFWSELLDDEYAWSEARQDCPGMGSFTGHVYSPEENRVIRDQGLSTN